MPTAEQKQQKNQPVEPRFKIDQAASPMPEPDSQNASRPRARSNRNGGRDHLGILGEIKSVDPGEIIGIRNRKDADAMAAAFAEDGIRVTPSGIFRGRDAIHRNLQDVLNMGLHDYTVQRMYLVQWARSCLTLESGGPS